MSNLVPTKVNVVSTDEDAVKDYWEHQFGSTYGIGDITEENEKTLRTLVSSIPKGRLLDNGCGDGRIKKFYEDLGWEVYGIDISKNAIMRASKIAPLNLICGVSEDLPFRDSFFDVVFSWRVFHSLDRTKRQAAVRETARVLRTGGTFIISVQSAEDIETIKYYKKNGIEVSDDPNSFVSDMQVEERKVQRLKHFYAKDDLKREIEIDSVLKVEEISEYREKAGWRDEIQVYWIAKAVKVV